MKRIIFIFFFSLSFASFPFKAYSHVHNSQQIFEIKQDHLYVFPHCGLVRKIDKASGRIEWESQVMVSEGSDNPLTWGSYSLPVFEGDELYAIELFNKTLLSFNKNTGQSILRIPVWGFACNFSDFYREGLLMNHITICGGLLIVGGDHGVEARRLPSGQIAWNFNCNEGDLYLLHGYLNSDNSLYLCISCPKKGVELKNASQDRKLLKNELVEVDCTSGEIRKRYVKEVFFGAKPFDMWSVINLEKWQDKALFLVEAGPLNYSLFTIDPVTREPVSLIKNMNDVGTKKGVWPHQELRTVILDNTIFYQLADQFHASAALSLIGRSLFDGKVLLNKNVFQGEILYAGGGGKLFSLMLQEGHFTIICRNAAAGNILWKRKIRLRGEDQSLADDKQLPIPFALDNLEIKFSEGRLYLMTLSYLYAFDAEKGEQLWKIPISPDEGDASESEQSFWSKIRSLLN